MRVHAVVQGVWSIRHVLACLKTQGERGLCCAGSGTTVGNGLTGPGAQRRFMGSCAWRWPPPWSESEANARTPTLERGRQRSAGSFGAR